LNPVIESLPILILYPHSRCNCRCVMCDIWKDPNTAEIGTADLERHLADIERLSVQWVVLSGGEPLMHSDLFRFCSLLRKRRIRITLLSTGLLLERNAASIVETIDDVIVSLDGPPAIHDRIRRVPKAFETMKRGIEAILRLRPAFSISARSTVQRENYGFLRETARAAEQLGLRSISFLAADLTSDAFNRPQPWSPNHRAQIALTESEIVLLENEIERLAAEWEGTCFIAESPEKLRRIALHYRAHLNLCEPVAPQCNAPWVSAVVEANGVVRPCFFHPPIGRLNGSSLPDVVNSPEARNFRRGLDVATNPICRRCVCSLNWKAQTDSRGLQSFYTVPTT
jgi:Fe-coproporphyrin III synthase